MFLPDSSSEERIKRIQPIMHLFVISGLKQYSTMFCTHGECVRGLLKEWRKKRITSFLRFFTYNRAWGGIFGRVWWITNLQHCLLVLTVLHLGRGEVEDSPLHSVSLCVVDVDVWPPHDNVALHPSVGVWLQEMYVPFLWHNGAAKIEVTRVNPRKTPQQQKEILLQQTHLTLISWISGTNLRIRGLVSEAPLTDFLASASCGVSGLGLTARERGVGGLQYRNNRSIAIATKEQNQNA